MDSQTREERTMTHDAYREGYFDAAAGRSPKYPLMATPYTTEQPRSTEGERTTQEIQTLDQKREIFCTEHGRWVVEQAQYMALLDKAFSLAQRLESANRNERHAADQVIEWSQIATEERQAKETALSKLSRIEAETVELRKDAERYRWLRRDGQVLRVEEHIGLEERWDCWLPFVPEFSKRAAPEAFDAAIDRALLKSHTSTDEPQV